MRGFRRSLVLAAVLGVLLPGSACSLVDGLGGPDPVAASTPAGPVVPPAYDSHFTRDGTFQSHIGFRGLDFVYTLYPTKSTPRTNEWYPRGKKYFSFTFQAYDLNQGLRAPFASKRKVYLGDIKVTSSTILTSGAAGVEQPYQLDAVAANVTFDPEAVTTANGMLITSPKGAFELRNQEIGEMAPDTFGVDLTFTATVFAQEGPGSTRFIKHTVRQKVPMAIFTSDQPTSVASIPVDAN